MLQNVYGNHGVNIPGRQVIVQVAVHAPDPAIGGEAAIEEREQIRCRLQRCQFANIGEAEEKAGKRPDSGADFDDSSADMGAEEL